MASSITPNMTVAELVETWLNDLRVEGRLETTTINEYERILRKLVVPALGDHRLFELSTERIDVLLFELMAQSVNRQRKAKVITGAMLDSAAARGAIGSNPVRGSLSIHRPKAAAKEVTHADVQAARAAVRAWSAKNRPGPKSSSDLADIIDLMLGTGARIGEVLAMRWRDVDLAAATLDINATIKTETGKGTYRKALSSPRTVELATSAVDVLRRRQQSGRRNGLDAVFTTRNGTWHQVNNVERRWRQVRATAGLDWVTPDDFRSLAQ
jgi:integrase